jgi:hypothetical protein
LAAKRHEITQDALLEELKEARQSALSDNQASAVVAASMVRQSSAACAKSQENPAISTT